MFKAFTLENTGTARSLVTEVEAIPNGTVNPNSKEKKCNAIWDTGATNSTISTTLAKECNLVPITKVTTSTANGMRDCDVYLVDILLPNSVCVKDVQVTECELNGDFDMLIGMDIISQGDFCVTNLDGKTVFTFRMPSCARVDYVSESNEMMTKELEKQKEQGLKMLKQHGNDKCPCGSNLKYRFCCGKREMKILEQQLQEIGKV